MADAKKKAVKKSTTTKGKDSIHALKMRITQLEKSSSGLVYSYNKLNEAISAATEKLAKLAKSDGVAKLSVELEKLRKEVEQLKSHGGRNRGPKSTRVMTEEDANKVISGELAHIAVRKAAEMLGLSYGQVYSARGGYTFKSLQPVKGSHRG